MERKLNDGEKYAFINKAADIALAAAGHNAAPDLLTEIMDKAYAKMVELAERK